MGAPIAREIGWASDCDIYSLKPYLIAPHAGAPHYLGALTLLAGHQRIEAGWLEGDAHCVLRDYFIVRSPGVGLVWVYRERLRPQGVLGTRSRMLSPGSTPMATHKWLFPVGRGNGLGAL